MINSWDKEKKWVEKKRERERSQDPRKSNLGSGQYEKERQKTKKKKKLQEIIFLHQDTVGGLVQQYLTVADRDGAGSRNSRKNMYFTLLMGLIIPSIPLPGLKKPSFQCVSLLFFCWVVSVLFKVGITHSYHEIIIFQMLVFIICSYNLDSILAQNILKPYY